MIEKRTVYFDNAATTPLDAEVIAVMLEAMQRYFGNPSSIHGPGREVRSQIEKVRKKVSQLLNCSPSEIFFTSGGTEADNMAIVCAVRDLNIKHVISSAIEHHAVLHTLEYLKANGEIELSFVNIDKCGRVDFTHLELLLNRDERSMVSLMHANNETGTMIDLDLIGEICHRHNAVFHSDTVQTMGHYAFDLKKTPIDFLTCAAHKMHGPKGVGFIYVRNTVKVKPFIHGGSQERNMRGGTENVYGILGLSKALDLAYEHLDEHQAYISGLKKYMLESLNAAVTGIEVNGCTDPAESLYTVLNISLPAHEMGDMLLFNLDINGIAASGGSACASGSSQGSHVLAGLGIKSDRSSVRFSFNRYNTREEVDYVVAKLVELTRIKETV